MQYEKKWTIGGFHQLFVESPETTHDPIFFSERYGAAKSSISEDLVIIKRIFDETEVGTVETFAGVSGGVIFTPAISDDNSRVIATEIADLVTESNRILPGGYIYLSDILGSPKISIKSAKSSPTNTSANKSMR